MIPARTAAAANNRRTSVRASLPASILSQTAESALRELPAAADEIGDQSEDEDQGSCSQGDGGKDQRVDGSDTAIRRKADEVSGEPKDAGQSD
jgi:hypothetical protein